MKRREFFQRMGLGAGGLLIASGLTASPFTASSEAENLLDWALEEALQRGASYAEACIGSCEVFGRSGALPQRSLFQSDLLGMRICTEKGWRHFLLGEWNTDKLEMALERAFEAPLHEDLTDLPFTSAVFDRHKVLAQRSSDSSLAAELNHLPFRFAERAALPQSQPDLLFCDLLIIQ